MNENIQDEISQSIDNGGFKSINFDAKTNIFPLIWFTLSIVLMLSQWIVRLNLVALIGVIFMALTAVLITAGIFWKKKLYLFLVLSYMAVSYGIFAYYVISGADAGFGAFSSGIKGFSTTANGWLQGEGTFWTRLLGNMVLMSPMALVLLGLLFATYCIKNNKKAQKIVAGGMSILLVVISAVFVFYMNLRSNPKVFDLTKGHDDYLNSISKNRTVNTPNVIVILMDDLGYGDVGFYQDSALYNSDESITPNIDSLAYDGIRFDNFYASYSVCSPSRFALMTGRYPYRGNADNVMYPTVNTTSVFARTRVFNSIEMGANVDGLLGDEITVAETLKASGYNTACIGKWHLGDYGQYLPTNQGFDYFYGSHQVNDMMPYYFVEEKEGQYTIDYSAYKSNDENALQQEDTSKILHTKLTGWLDEQIDDGNPFFAYYSTPWPHAPVFSSEEFNNYTGLGTYADCVSEFDNYVGQLKNYLADKNVLNDTIIMFASDNGPALQGSTGGLRGGKYTPYEAGQKVPFFIYFGENYKTMAGITVTNGDVVSAPITMVDIFPTLVDLLDVSSESGVVDYLPIDRSIDGVSILPLLNNSAKFIHGVDNPILHMKREKLLAIQYSMSSDDLLSKYGVNYNQYDYVLNNDYLTFKYFEKVANDNLAFFDKKRVNWLICLTADQSESYNIQPTYNNLSNDMLEKMQNIRKDFKSNRRGYDKSYYD